MLLFEGYVTAFLRRRGVEYTLDGLLLDGIMGCEFDDALNRWSCLDRLCQVLQNNAAWEIGVLSAFNRVHLCPMFPPTSTKCARFGSKDATSWVNGATSSQSPSRGTLISYSNHLSFSGSATRPREKVKLGVEDLVPCIFASGVTLIFGFSEVIKKGLVGWPTNVEALPLGMIPTRPMEDLAYILFMDPWILGTA